MLLLCIEKLSVTVCYFKPLHVEFKPLYRARVLALGHACKIDRPILNEIGGLLCNAGLHLLDKEFEEEIIPALTRLYAGNTSVTHCFKKRLPTQYDGIDSCFFETEAAKVIASPGSLEIVAARDAQLLRKRLY